MTDLTADQLKAQAAELRRLGQVGRIREVEVKLKERITGDLRDFVARKTAGKAPDKQGGFLS